jgi:ABC-2 type transport system permease protein
LKAAWALVLRRELWSAFVSPATWAAVGAAWVLLALVFKNGVLPGVGGDLRDAIIASSDGWWWIQFFLAPLWCMRLLSEERRTGTFEALMTAPVTDAAVVLGKYLSAVILLALTALIIPLLMAMTLPFDGRPDWGQLASAYCAFVGTGAVLCAVGVFASALTQSQVLAAFLALVLNTVLTSLPNWAAMKFPPDHVIRRALARGSLLDQMKEGAAGVMDGNHVAFQTVASALFLLFAVRTLESRKWR